MVAREVGSDSGRLPAPRKSPSSRLCFQPLVHPLRTEASGEQRRAANLGYAELCRPRWRREEQRRGLSRNHPDADTDGRVLSKPGRAVGGWQSTTAHIDGTQRESKDEREAPITVLIPPRLVQPLPPVGSEHIRFVV